MTRLMTTAAAFALLAGGAWAADPLTLQLKWVTQAQFAGYYVAKDKGFYGDENLDVTIRPGGPDIAPTQVLAGGGADVTVEWMPAALAARVREETPRWEALVRASGARLALTATRQLHPGGGRYPVVSMCIGVGQGIAALVERVEQQIAGAIGAASARVMAS